MELVDVNVILASILVEYVDEGREGEGFVLHVDSVLVNLLLEYVDCILHGEATVRRWVGVNILEKEARATKSDQERKEQRLERGVYRGYRIAVIEGRYSHRMKLDM
ncbi:ATP synthase subunit alpha [Striga asiatica]|uniref:ATP synthase subunit alpha n=1 Tax=Striga asiatica TaxID=4170 RepID=A0A5A7QUH4_STRAF|nr:ATP synthase subunit alpha [Striga asiatica]